MVGPALGGDQGWRWSTTQQVLNAIQLRVASTCALDWHSFNGSERASIARRQVASTRDVDTATAHPPSCSDRARQILIRSRDAASVGDAHSQGLLLESVQSFA